MWIYLQSSAGFTLFSSTLRKSHFFLVNLLLQKYTTLLKLSKSKPTLYLVFYFGISQNLDITVSTEEFHYYVIWTVDISID